MSEQLKRYDLSHGITESWMSEDADGDWVRYSDVEKVLASATDALDHARLWLGDTSDAGVPEWVMEKVKEAHADLSATINCQASGNGPTTKQP